MNGNDDVTSVPTTSNKQLDFLFFPTFVWEWVCKFFYNFLMASNALIKNYIKEIKKLYKEGKEKVLIIKVEKKK